MKIYRPFSLTLMVLFAATGLLFLFAPDGVLGLFNSMSARWGMEQLPMTGVNFFRVLAVGYMYLVSVLAFLMFRRPENRYFPFLLINAKLASSLLSLALFLWEGRYLIFLANFVVDGAIGIAVAALYLKARKLTWVSP